ncbi:unnamed protein product, partial [Rotaria sp. Silwood2]
MEEDSEEDTDDKIDDSYYPPMEEQQKSKPILNNILELLGITPITDTPQTQVLQQKVDDAYTKMRKLCSPIINRTEDSTRSHNFKLSMPDSDALIAGLQTMFKRSTDSEKLRVLTVAPVSWGRNTIVNFFDCAEHQARAAIELRLTDGILAFPTSCRGNQPIDPDTTEQVLNYYR